ncbi:MAG: homogentisate 1,2-dioxygenase domain-containing protein [Vicinamibacterales bacterium]
MVDGNALYDADGGLLLVPQSGALRLCTEFGIIDIEPGEVAVVPRGVKIRVEALPAGPARNYLCENYGGAFTLPDRGPIGANCLANPARLPHPGGGHEDRDNAVADMRQVRRRAVDTSSSITRRSTSRGLARQLRALQMRPAALFAGRSVLYDRRPVDLPADLAVGDASTANIDFVIFPDRWMVAENASVRRGAHMNVMSSSWGWSGNATSQPQGFVPGGFSLHNTMLPHGPDEQAFETASNVALAPKKLEGTMAFMFETRFPQRVTHYAATVEVRQDGYAKCGRHLRSTSTPKRP